MQVQHGPVMQEPGRALMIPCHMLDDGELPGVLHCEHGIFPRQNHDGTLDEALMGPCWSGSEEIEQRLEAQNVGDLIPAKE